MYKFLILLISITFSLNATSLNWEKDYQTAIKKAEAENRAILVMVSAPTCPECNYMKKNIFTKPDIKSYIDKNFIVYQFLHESEEIPKQMKFWGIPRFYFTKDGENVYNKAMGGLKADKFLELLKESKL